MGDTFNTEDIKPRCVGCFSECENGKVMCVDCITEMEKCEQEFLEEHYRDRDIEEEVEKIKQYVEEIKDPEERLDIFQRKLEALEYDEYFAHNPQFLNEHRLSILRDEIKRDVPEDVSKYDLITHILDKSNMYSASYREVENILIMNVNKKFTFLNTIKVINDYHGTIERGLKKMKREYGNEWGEEDDEEIYEIVPLALKKRLY